MPGFLVQGGDITRTSGGTGGRSIYGPTFEDESFKIKHTGAGQLLMANFGLYDSNHSQFAVAMDRVTEFEKNHVIFGFVMSGMEVRFPCHVYTFLHEKENAFSPRVASSQRMRRSPDYGQNRRLYRNRISRHMRARRRFYGKWSCRDLEKGSLLNPS